MRNILVLLAVLMMPSTVFAQELPKGKTTYKSVESKAAMEKTIEAGIEDAVEDMSFITRPIARKKLKNTNLAFSTMTIHYTGDSVSVQHGSRNPVESDLSASKFKWTSKDGETYTVSQEGKNNEIVQTFYDEDGTKTLKYVFSSDFSKMTVHVTLNSPKLSGPMKYKLAYEKQ